MAKASPSVLPSGPEGKKTWGARATDGIATVYAGLSHAINGTNPEFEFQSARVMMWRSQKAIKKAADHVRKLVA